MPPKKNMSRPATRTQSQISDSSHTNEDIMNSQGILNTQHNNPDPQQASQGVSDFTNNLVAALQNQRVRDLYIDILRPKIVEEIHSVVQPINNNLEQLSDKFLAYEINTDMVQAETRSKLEELKTKNEILENKIKVLDRQARLCNIKLVGLKTNIVALASDISASTADSPSDQATPSAMASHQEILKNSVISALTDAGMKDVSKQDILHITTLKSPGNGNTYLLRLCDEQKKIGILKQKKLLKNLPYKLYLNEDLTREDSDIYRQCRLDVKNKKLHATWTRNCEVMAKASAEGKPFKVKKMDY